MKECPYCKQCFSTKQRLVSHLTKTKKCYDADQAGGASAVLLGLIGLTEPSELDDVTMGTPDTKQGSKETDFQCPICHRYFINDRNLTRHLTNNKCPKTKLKVKVAIEGGSGSGIETDIHAPKAQVKRCLASKKTDQTLLSSGFKRPGASAHVKYLVIEDYLIYLTQLYGSEEDAFRFIRTCLQNKMRGDLNLIYKIYFENREITDYPIEIIDAKNKKLYYRTPDNIVADDGGAYIKSILIDNIQNCYIKYSNHIISSNITDTDILFNEYDLMEVQNHMLDLSDDRTKERLISGLIDLLKK